VDGQEIDAIAAMQPQLGDTAADHPRAWADQPFCDNGFARADRLEILGSGEIDLGLFAQRHDLAHRKS
jgi:hypothetical protein